MSIDRLNNVLFGGSNKLASSKFVVVFKVVFKGQGGGNYLHFLHRLLNLQIFHKFETCLLQTNWATQKIHKIAEVTKILLLQLITKGFKLKIH